MIWLLRKMLHQSRSNVALLLYTLVIVQSIGLAHSADQNLHPDGAPCRVCDAIGPVAAPPTPVSAPTAPTLTNAAAVAIALPWLEISPSFSSHVPRAPPSLL
jgi:hypothetical protein